jgi:hypothetical protein
VLCIIYKDNDKAIEDMLARDVIKSSGYWHVEVEPKDSPKTAVATRKGLYPFQVMSFGLYGALATLQRFTETVLAGLQWDICLRYLDACKKGGICVTCFLGKWYIYRSVESWNYEDMA